MARPSLLDKEPELREVIAELHMLGKTRQEIADVIQRGVHKDTITDYLADAGVRAICDRLTRERVRRITRKIDVALEARLEHVDKIDTETLLKIRKEMMPDRVEISTNDDRGSIMDELWDAADRDPEVARRLEEAAEAAGGD